MHRFSVHCGDALIGWSDLETGDPPMGTAFGRFVPAPEYSQVRAAFIAATEQRGSAPLLSLRGSGGESIESAGGVHITDLGMDSADIEVAVFGVSDPPYDSLFPEHVAAYERLYPRS